MARMYPAQPFDWNESPAEQSFFFRCKEELSNDYVGLHSVHWLQRQRGMENDGEADFVLLHPEFGLLVVEVKGGAISRDAQSGRWASTDRHGVWYEIDDPFQQAERSMYALRDKLRDAPATAAFDFKPRRAVAFPNTLAGGANFGPSAPRDLIIDSADLTNFEESVMQAWNPGQQAGPGIDGVKGAIAVLSPTVTLDKPGLRGLIEGEQREQIKLTGEQLRAFDMVAHMPRLAVHGVAGSGKTLIALNQTRRLAEQGFEVLFTCYNKGLATWAANWLVESLDQSAASRIMVANYHELAESIVRQVGVGLPRASELSNPETANCYYQEELPRLLLSTLPDWPERFDAIIVDEGQDFADIWWESLLRMLRDPDSGVLQLFYDDRQKIYTQRGDEYPVPEPHIQLLHNYRNTQLIHKNASKYVGNQTSGDCPGPKGRKVDVIAAAPGDEVRALRGVIHDLVHDQRIDSSEIVVLTPRSQRTSRLEDGESLGNCTLRWKGEGSGVIRIDSISAFKGLEAPIVILVELDRISIENPDALIHVGLTRACHHAIVIGELPKAQT